MPKTMRAAVLRELKTPLKIEAVAMPEPGPGEVLIKVAACGVCHSDVHAVDGDWDPLPGLPLIPGHEVTGHVAACGAYVQGLKDGDVVGVPWMWSACGGCEYCLAGDETICASGESTGYSKPGGYAEYITAPAAYVGRLPATGGQRSHRELLHHAAALHGHGHTRSRHRAGRAFLRRQGHRHQQQADPGKLRHEFHGGLLGAHLWAWMLPPVRTSFITLLWVPSPALSMVKVKVSWPRPGSPLSHT